VFRLAHFVNRSFGRRISFYFIPLIVGLLAVVAVLSYSVFFNAFRQENTRTAGLLVQQIGVNFDNYFRDAKTTIAFLYDNNGIQRAFSSYQSLTFEQRVFLNMDIDGFTENVNIFRNYLRDVLFLGENGYQRNLPNYYRIASGRSVLDSEWLRPYRHLTERGIYFTPPHMDNYYETTAIPSLVVSVILPVFQQGKLAGLIVGDIDYAVLSRVLEEIYRQNQIDVSMVTADGVLVFNRDQDLVNTRLGLIEMDKVTGDQGEFTYTDRSGRHLGVFRKSPVTGWYLVATVPFSAMLKPSEEVSRTIIFVLLPLSVLCAVAMTFLLSRRIRQPLALLVRRMELVNFDSYESAEILFADGEIGNLAHKFEEMLARIDQLVVKTYRLEIRQRDAQFEALRNQIAPHFMYNALQLIKTEAVLSGNDEISSIVTSFGNLLRYAIEYSPALVTVEDECNYVSDYLSIYQRRFGRSFEFQVKIETGASSLPMQKLVLQPVVENCIRHGLHETISGGRIDVDVVTTDKFVLITVTDNGKGIPEARLHETLSKLDVPEDNRGPIGLHNVHQRIRMKDGPDCGIISIVSRPGHTAVTLRFRREVQDV